MNATETAVRKRSGAEMSDAIRDIEKDLPKLREQVELTKKAREAFLRFFAAAMDANVQLSQRSVNEMLGAVDMRNIMADSELENAAAQLSALRDPNGGAV